MNLKKTNDFTLFCDWLAIPEVGWFPCTCFIDMIIYIYVRVDQAFHIRFVLLAGGEQAHLNNRLGHCSEASLDQSVTAPSIDYHPT